MAYPNGGIPASALRPIAGDGHLVPAAAAAWNAMANYIYERTGQKIAPKGPYSTYRTYAMQVEMKRIYGSNAATPGTSNHGWGLAVDTAWDALINQYGAQFGWQKAWSDASWEPWHFAYREGWYTGRDPGPDYASHPKWWRRVTGAIADLRVKRRDKKRRRRATDNPARKSKLHRQIQRIGDHIQRLLRRKAGEK